MTIRRSKRLKLNRLLKGALYATMGYWTFFGLKSANWGSKWLTVAQKKRKFIQIKQKNTLLKGVIELGRSDSEKTSWQPFPNTLSTPSLFPICVKKANFGSFVVKGASKWLNIHRLNSQG